MIIFSTIKDIPSELLEYKRIRQVIYYNLSSYYNSADIPMLNCLIPSVEFIPEEQLLGDCTSPEFDINYHNYIINNNDAFKQFMNLIIPVQQSPDVLVVVLIRHTPYSDAILESLLKLIQQRYGYNCYIINELEDLLYVEEPSFNIPGLFAYDNDIMRYQSICPEIMNCGDYDD